MGSQSLLQIPTRLLPGIAMLAEARRYAFDLARDVWDFAVEISALQELGFNNNDLRWLICRGCIDHATESRKPTDQGRRFQRGSSLTFTERACFVLTEAGADLSLRLLDTGVLKTNGAPFDASMSRDERQAPRGPHWDNQTREFRFGNWTIKSFRLPSPNQQTVLTAFEEEGWPLRIDDPLPPDPTICPKRRLHDTIKSLNRNQRYRLVRFTGDGTGQGVCWQAIFDDAQTIRLSDGD
jgi:hypothetical protein